MIERRRACASSAVALDQAPQPRWPSSVSGFELQSSSSPAAALRDPVPGTTAVELATEPRTCLKLAPALALTEEIKIKIRSKSKIRQSVLSRLNSMPVVRGTPQLNGDEFD